MSAPVDAWLHGHRTTCVAAPASASPPWGRTDLPQKPTKLPFLSCANPQDFPCCFPESRCDKDLDTLSGYALCLPNLARLQTYRFAEHRPILCVEIKVNFWQWEVVWGEGKVSPGSESMSHLLEHTFHSSSCSLGPFLRPRPPPAPKDSACFLLHLMTLVSSTGQTRGAWLPRAPDVARSWALLQAASQG